MVTRPGSVSITRICLVLGTIFACYRPDHAQAQLYVGQSFGDIPGQPVSATVGTYDTDTGAAIDPSLFTGISSAAGLALSGNTLFVTDGRLGDGSVSTYDATTGATIQSGTSGIRLGGRCHSIGVM